jgi:hypothetical protein
MFAFWINFIFTAPGCEDPPSTTCNNICDSAKPAECSGGGQILSVNESGEEEPLGTESYWMCVCRGEDNRAIQFLSKRVRCAMPRESVAYGEGEAGYSDD